MIRVSRAIIVMHLNKIKWSLLIHKSSLINRLLGKVFAIIQFDGKSKPHIAFPIQQTSIYKLHQDIV